MHARVTIAENANQRISDVKIWRYFVFVTLKNPNGAAITTNAARNILNYNQNIIFKKDINFSLYTRDVGSFLYNIPFHIVRVSSYPNNIGE